MKFKDSTRYRSDLISLALICLVIQVAVAPYIGLGNGRINMALVFAGIVSLLVGGRTGVLYGFCAGFLFDLSTSGPIGLMSFLLTIASFVVGSEVRNRIGDNFVGSLRIFFWMDVIVSLLYHVSMFLVGEATSIANVLFLRTLPTTVLTLLVFAPFAYLFSRSTGNALNLGGKPSKSSKSHGSRYDFGSF